MKLSKKFLSLLLCVVMVAGSVGVGGEGLAQLFSFQADAYETVKFGNYPQTKVTNSALELSLKALTPNYKGIVTDPLSGKRYYKLVQGTSATYYEYEPIYWRVLDTSQGRKLLVSERILDGHQWNGSYGATWQNCSLSSFLDNDFYNLAFTQAEKSQIIYTDPDGNGGAKNHVFCLSYEEAINKFTSNSDRIASPTNFASARTSYSNWWLRSRDYYPYYVNSGGGIDMHYNMTSRYSVRPALLLNQGSVIFESKSSSEYGITVVDRETSLPISGVNVNLDGVCYTTDSNGNVKVMLNAYATGDEVISFEKNGYSTKSGFIYEFDSHANNTVKLLKDYGVSEVLANVMLSGEKITGPEVNILGYKFNLFEYDASIELPLDKFVVKTAYETKTKTLKATIGIKSGYEVSGSATGDDVKEVLQNYEDMKNFYGCLRSGSSIGNRYAELMEKAESAKKGSLGFEAEMKVCGYMEWDYSTGKLVIKEGGIVVTASTGVKKDLPFWGICYATFGVKGEIEGKLYLEQNASGILSPGGSLGFSVKPSVGVGAKAIDKNIASVEVGLEGKINASLKFPASTFRTCFSAYLNANAYVKVKALWVLEHKWHTNFPNLELYPNFGHFQTEAVDEGDLKLIDRSYLNTMRTQAIGDISENAVYPYGSPNLLKLDDGRTVALYLYDDGTKTDINRTTLYYSVYSNGSWSVSQPVCNSGLADFPVQAVTDGEKIYAVWQRASEVLENDYGTQDIVTKTNLVYAVFNGEGWSTPAVIDGADKYQCLYSVAAHNGAVTVAWAENSENDYTLLTGTESVYTKTLSDSEWSEAVTVTSGKIITDLSVRYNGASAEVAYCVDTDNNLETNGDQRVYLNDSAVSSIGTDAYDLTAFDGSFYWIENDILYTFSSSAVSTGLALENDYRVLKCGEKTAVVYLRTDGFKNELYVSYLGTYGFSNPVALTAYGNHIGYYDAVLNSDGSVTVLANVDMLDDNAVDSPYGNTDMICETIGETTDIAMAYCYLEGNMTANADVTFKGAITNIATADVDKYRIDVTASNGQVVRTVTSYELLSGGETREFGIGYTLPENFAGETYTVSVVAEGESKTDDNALTVTAGFADIAILNQTVNESGLITATVINNGCCTAEDVEATVTYYAGESELLTTVNCGTLAPGETFALSYTVPADYLGFNADYVSNKFEISVSTTSDEENIADNSVYVLLSPKQVTGVSLSAETLNLALGAHTQLTAVVTPSDAFNRGVRWISDSVDVATVDANGIVTTNGEGQAIITAITENGNMVAHCTVNVSVTLLGIDMSEKNVAMQVGDTRILSCNFNPTNATNKGIIFSSSVPSVASVSSSGAVTAIATGTTVITATSSEGGFTTSCEITVTNPVKGIALSDGAVDIYANQTKQLCATVSPANADNTAVVWESSDSDVASVNGNGLITAGIPGYATITVTTADGGFTASC